MPAFFLPPIEWLDAADWHALEQELMDRCVDYPNIKLEMAVTAPRTAAFVVESNQRFARFELVKPNADTWFVGGRWDNSTMPEFEAFPSDRRIVSYRLLPPIQYQKQKDVAF